MRKIRVMADFSSSGLWDDDCNGVMIEYEDLGLLTDLITEFEEWIRHYDLNQTSNFDGFMPGKALESQEMGRKLAKKLKTMFPEDQIEYWYENETGNWKDGSKLTKEIINA
jgi:hypothetical protein